MADDPGGPIFQGLIARGFSPVHAAAIVGNIQQESGFNPGAVNPREDAHGLIQWRQDRWNALQDFAKARGASPADRDTQLDFIQHEMRGTERRAGDRFMAATDLPSANTALRGYIRYGDDSQGTRLTNASRYLGGADQAPIVASAAPSAAPAAPQQQPAAPAAFGSLAPAAPGDPSAQAPEQAQAAPAMQPQQPPYGAQPEPEASPFGRMAMPLTSAAKARLFAVLAGRPPA